MEIITNSSIVFRRVNNGYISNTKEVTPNLFKLRTNICEKYLSVNRNKYCKTPDESLKKALLPENNSVLSLVVSDIRNNCELSVIHSPSGYWPFYKDKSHSSIIPPIEKYKNIISEGQIKLIYRQYLANYAKWEIITKKH